MMNANELLAELTRPVTDRAVLYAMLSFCLLLMLARAAGMLGLWLMIVTVPAFCRFLMGVMQARIEGRPTDPPGVEMFSLAGSLWAFLPLVQVVIAVAVVLALTDAVGVVAAAVVGIAFTSILPASVGVLALTQSPVAALNPVAMAQLVRECGRPYLLIPATAGLAGVGLVLGHEAGLPGWSMQLAEVYGLFLLFSLTGAIVAGSGARELVAGPDPVEPDAAMVEAAAERQRRDALGHAYGLFSRGNSAGGLKRLQEFADKIGENGDKIREYRWFFEKMLAWEDTFPALMLGQRYLALLLAAGEHGQAMKTLSRCLLVDPAFRPLPEDREALLDVADSLGRDDLAGTLRTGPRRSP